MVTLTSRVMVITRVVMIFFSLIGNVISFMVFSRPVFRKNSISTYCRALAIFDFFTIADMIASIGLGFFDTFYPFYSDVACKAYMYSIVGFASIPGWILIAFSLDKVLTMKRIGTDTLKKKSFQYGIIVTIALANLLLYVEIPIYIQVVTIKVYDKTIYLCDSSTLPFGTFVAAMFLIEGSLLPFLIMFVSSIVSIKMIRDSTRKIERNSNADLTNRKSKDFKFAISSVVFNISFIVFKLPITVVFILENIIPNLAADYSLLAVVGTVSFIHYTSSFLVHLLTNSIFRREFMILFKIQKPRIVDSFQLNNNALAINRRSNAVSITINKM